MTAVVSALVVTGSPAGAQERLSLDRAVSAALSGNPEVQASRAATAEAAERVLQARAGLLPRVNLVESWQWGNQPVFVFGSLLAQRQFSDANFGLERLNHPDSISNYRTALSVEQVLFDGGRASAGTRAATLGHAMAQSAGRQAANDLALATARAYGQVLLASTARRAAETAVTTADEDARTAAARRDAGVGAEADVLSLQVHLAQMRERALNAESDEVIARAELNRLMGVPLDLAFELDEPAAAEIAEPAREALEQQELRLRPEAEQATLQRDVARTLERSANAAWLPEVALQGSYEWNGGTFGSRAPAWTVGTQVRLNLFAGMGDRARQREAPHRVERAEAERARAEAAVRLDVRSAAARLSAARAREAVGSAMVIQARESQRMIRDPFEAGMAATSDVLRAANAVLDAETQRIGALVDVMIDQAALRRAVGMQEGTP